ncbi:QRFP-like peptide receptor [Myxocyprinus asiaticus]|uniref:QRFP-like peptide receptor n=1 Tax=Myxocyprinus asiaticus TaxID=70543 RepID=UPI0022224BA2|nr:QRFP-like peptide receptor [Myxocyprinus asiaticus]XP_051570021.1 QRFP-like peptide receptor [Myxocyprinus asiaticus]
MNFTTSFLKKELQLSNAFLSLNGSLREVKDFKSDYFLHQGGELERLLLLTIKEPTTIALTVMYSLSFVVGFIGNLMAIRMLTCQKSNKMKSISATRSLLINLSVCDLMVVCICMPITLGHTIYTAWVYGDLLCRAVPFIQAVSVSASVLSLTVISVNRYYSVHNPLNSLSYFTQKKIYITIVGVWVVSSVICAPLLFMIKVDEIHLIDIVVPICRELWPRATLKQAYNVLLFVALYCIPVTFNLIISFLTGRKLWWASQHFTDFDPHSQAMHASCLKMRKKIAKVVVTLVLLFAVSWLPLYVADILIDQEVHPPHWVLQTRPFAQWLGLTNSSLNPICYCLLGDLYRSARAVRSKYHQRMLSVLGSSSSRKLSRFLSLKQQQADQRQGAVSQVSMETLSDWCSNNSQMVSIQSISGRIVSRSNPELSNL